MSSTVLKRFQCTIGACTKSFTRNEALQAHIHGTHYNAKPYRCRHCDVRFTRIGDRNKHKNNIHANIRLFRCKANGCDEAYPTRYQLNRHLSRFPQHAVEERGVNLARGMDVPIPIPFESTRPQEPTNIVQIPEIYKSSPPPSPERYEAYDPDMHPTLEDHRVAASGVHNPGAQVGGYTVRGPPTEVHIDKLVERLAASMAISFRRFEDVELEYVHLDQFYAKIANILRRHRSLDPDLLQQELVDMVDDLRIDVVRERQFAESELANLNCCRRADEPPSKARIKRLTRRDIETLLHQEATLKSSSTFRQASTAAIRIGLQQQIVYSSEPGPDERGGWIKDSLYAALSAHELCKSILSGHTNSTLESVVAQSVAHTSHVDEVPSENQVIDLDEMVDADTGILDFTDEPSRKPLTMKSTTPLTLGSRPFGPESTLWAHLSS